MSKQKTHPCFSSHLLEKAEMINKELLVTAKAALRWARGMGDEVGKGSVSLWTGTSPPSLTEDPDRQRFELDWTMKSSHFARVGETIKFVLIESIDYSSNSVTVRYATELSLINVFHHRGPLEYVTLEIIPRSSFDLGRLSAAFRDAQQAWKDSSPQRDEPSIRLDSVMAEFDKAFAERLDDEFESDFDGQLVEYFIEEIFLFEEIDIGLTDEDQIGFFDNCKTWGEARDKIRAHLTDRLS